MNMFVKIFKVFNDAKVKYLVIGGVAVNLHGYPRFTGDLDVLLFLNKENLSRVDVVMKKLGYSERLPVSIMNLSDGEQVKKWVKEKNFKAFTFNPPEHELLQIDIVIEESLKFEQFYGKKLMKEFSGVKIPVVSLGDLIQMKKKTGRSKDEDDLQVLKHLSQL
ncbi:MAG: hypothetical protein US89_C0007G0067 [Candidatus Peregrinibacteria bacterium GW2011_GWF2_38_29]|nr:MAG: hypothetical protein US89_C0007G0067 [Candidatus Peregrinibacteria bacterium GW2011_GWF2_38_29]HBB02882.1 hypothetical protein [Candidatus Peregrinibacteria bacterium]